MQNFGIEFEYLGLLIAELKRYAGTGCLICQHGEDQCALYYHFGMLIHAQVGEQVGPLALSRLLAWRSGQLSFESKMTYAGQSLTAQQEEIFMQTLRWLQKQGRLQALPTQYQPSRLLSAPAIASTLPAMAEVQANQVVARIFAQDEIGPVNFFPPDEVIPAKVLALAETQANRPKTVSDASARASAEPAASLKFAQANPRLEIELEMEKTTITGPELSQPVEWTNFDKPVSSSPDFGANKLFDLTPPELKAGTSTAAKGAKSFELAKQILPPATLVQMQRDIELARHYLGANPDLRWLVNRVIQQERHGFISVDGQDRFYARLFFQEGQLVQAGFDDGHDHQPEKRPVEGNKALYRLFQLAPPPLTQITVGRVELSLLQAFFATQQTGRTAFKAIPAHSLNIKEQLTSLVYSHFSGAVKFYDPSRTIFYLMHQGKGLGGYEAQASGSLVRVNQKLDQFVSRPEVLVDIYPTPTTKNLVVEELLTY